MIKQTNQLERVLGTPTEFWSQREDGYRAYLASQKNGGGGN